MPYDIFISYKRKSLPTANNLYYRLTTRGYSTFFDLEEMGRDNFNVQLLNHIENAKDVFVILEDGSLDGCKLENWEEEDWFCHEIAFALEKKKNIIPILLNGYQMPSQDFFPDRLKELSLKNAPEFNFSFFEAYLDKLTEKDYLLSKPNIQDKATSVFKFYSNENCQVFKEGKLVCSLEGMSDVSYYLPVERSGDFRFKAVSLLSKDARIIDTNIDANKEKIIDIKWKSEETVSSDNNSEVGKSLFSCQLTLKHKDAVEFAAFSPCGDLILSAADDESICVWDVKKGLRLFRLQGHTDCVNSIAYNSDGSLIASASDDETIRIWNVESCECLHILCGHSDSVWSVAFRPDSECIASGSIDNTVRIWDVKSGSCIKILRGHTQDVNYVCYSPDGNRIISASNDGTIRIWDADSGNCLEILKGHSDVVWSAKYSINGEYVVSASADGTIRVWNANNGECLKIFEGHTDEVNSASFSSDGRTIVSASDDETIRIWDAYTGDCLQVLKGHHDFVNCVSFSPNDKMIVSASDDSTIKVWQR